MQGGSIRGKRYVYILDARRVESLMDFVRKEQQRE